MQRLLLYDKNVEKCTLCGGWLGEASSNLDKAVYILNMRERNKSYSIGHFKSRKKGNF